MKSKLELIISGKIMKSVFASLLLLGTSLSSIALEPYENFKEGSCSGVDIKSTRVTRDFVDSLKYIHAGSKYMLYRIASGHPGYREIPEEDLYYELCPYRNSTSVTQFGHWFGFGGRLLHKFHKRQKAGTYFEAVPVDPAKSWDYMRTVVTLTDSKSFAFISACWTGVDERAWYVLTRDPYIDRKTEKVIEEHAAKLGYDRRNFVFLRFDACRHRQLSAVTAANKLPQLQLQSPLQSPQPLYGTGRIEQKVIKIYGF